MFYRQEVILSGGFFIYFTKQNTIHGGGGYDLIDWDKVRKEFEESDITAKALADKHGIPSSTLYGRKNKEKWKRKKKPKKATDRVGGQNENTNARGNPGNKNASAPEGNKNAMSHGLFANYLPKEMLAIMTEVSQMTPADMVWQNILIQYTAIIRSQKIMFVRDEFDNYSNNVGIRLDPNFLDDKDKPVVTEEKREWHMAYERQEKFLSAQSRAMTTLSNLIKQFVSLADEDDERKLKLESLNANIAKATAEAKIAQDKADKLSANSKAFELLESLHNVIEGGDGSGDNI